MSSTYTPIPQKKGSESTAGVDSFNGRIGTVVSANGDYSAEMVSYDPTGTDLENPDHTPTINVQEAINALVIRSPVTDPTKVRNANYEYLDGKVITTDDTPTPVYQDTLDNDGIFLYETRIVGVEDAGAIYATFKRSFTVYKRGSTTILTDISSDYTHKVDSSWTLSVNANTSTITLVVKAAPGQAVQWVATLTKTMFTL